MFGEYIRFIKIQQNLLLYGIKMDDTINILDKNEPFKKEFNMIQISCLLFFITIVIYTVGTIRKVDLVYRKKFLLSLLLTIIAGLF